MGLNEAAERVAVLTQQMYALLGTAIVCRRLTLAMAMPRCQDTIIQTTHSCTGV